jgi:ubiquinone/menaquinone biosynthesis C-methylase UbiE
MAGSEPLPPETRAYYAREGETRRLFKSHGQIELARTKEILLRHLPPPPGTILDVGGGPGIYACWLAASGYRVHLIDAMPSHVEQARQVSARQPDTPVASLRVGDARTLEEGDAAADAVLLLGPLYHLTGRDDRIQALREARRVLRPGGLLFAVGIGRFASLLSGLVDNFLGDPDAREIVEGDLRDGQHRNPTAKDYFTTAFFHRPEELTGEVREAGFDLVDLLGVEGPAWLLADLERRWADKEEREQLLQAARAVEREPTLLGIHPHLLAVGRR